MTKLELNILELEALHILLTQVVVKLNESSHYHCKMEAFVGETVLNKVLIKIHKLTVKRKLEGKLDLSEAEVLFLKNWLKNAYLNVDDELHDLAVGLYNSTGLEVNKNDLLQ